jgi:hypothetical protein
METPAENVAVDDPPEFDEKDTRTRSAFHQRLNKAAGSGRIRPHTPGMSRHVRQASDRRTNTNPLLKGHRDRNGQHPDLGPADPVVFHTTQSFPWDRKARNRRRNKVARASRRANRWRS